MALDVKVLTENREEIEIKISDDDVGERAQEIGLLMGDEDPRLTQTAAAQREAEQTRGVAEVEAGSEEEEEEEEEPDDTVALVAPPTARAAEPDEELAASANGLRAPVSEDAELLTDVEEEPVEVVDEELEEGYTLEEEDEELAEEEEEEESPLGTIDRRRLLV